MTARITCPRSQLWTPATRPSHLRPRYPQLHDGMVLWACPTFGTAGNRLLDVSGYGNHGDMVNMDWTTDTVAGPYGSLALDFDGEWHYIDCGSLSGVRSVSCWAYIATHKDFNRLFAWRSLNAFSIMGRRIGTLEVRQDEYTIISGVVVSARKWYHHCVTMTTTTLRWYIDGVLVGSGAVTPTDTAGDWLWGSRIPQHGNHYLDGMLTDMALWDRALSAEEIKLLASRPLIAGEAIRVPMVSVPAPVGGGFNPAWAMNATVVAGVNCA